MSVAVPDRLDSLLTELRAELKEELPLKLHQGVPQGNQQTANEASEPAYGHMTGLPFSRQFDRYLNPAQHGGDFIASDTFTYVRDWCRENHWREQHHTDPDPFAWNLCSRLVIAIVEFERFQPLSHVAKVEEIDYWLAERLLTAALEEAEVWRANRRKGVIIADESRRELDEAEALPIVLAREHQVEHERRVWELWRSKFPYIRAWDSELTRRRAYHAVHCHDRCALLVGEAA